MFSLALALLVPKFQAPLADVPIEMVGNHIYVPAVVNGQKMMALFDSGAAVSIMDADLVDKWNLPWQGHLLIGGIGPEVVTGRLLTGITVSIGSVTEPLPASIPLYNITRAEGRPVNLVLGYEFFKDDVVQVDYPAKRLRIFPPGWKPDSEGTFLQIRLVQNCPHIVTHMVAGKDSFNLETLVDTGASRGCLTRRFLDNYALNIPTSRRALLGGGVGGDVQGFYLRPSQLTLGDQTVANPILTATLTQDGASGMESPYDLLLGGDVLSRFRVTFDYADSWMMLEPGAALATPFESDKTGLRIVTADGNLRVFKVAGVLGGSSSWEAGMLIGDYIEMVDGKPAAMFSLAELRELFRSPTSKGWDISVRRINESRVIHVNARNVI